MNSQVAMSSGDIVIRTERTLNDVVLEIDGKITTLFEMLQSQQKQLDEVKAELVKLDAHLTVIDGRLDAQQNTLGFIEYLLGIILTGATILFAIAPLERSLWVKLFAHIPTAEEIERLIDQKLAQRG